MAPSKKSNSTKKRIAVKALPVGEKKMTGKQLKKVKGGAGYIKFDGIDGEFMAKKAPK